MSRRPLHDERGGVMALSAFLIPVFLLLSALIVDVGNWFTHDRQLQNRADAGAFAAGIEYARNWKACVQTGDLALKQATAQEIANAARQYTANPDNADYTDLDPSGVVPATLYNDNIANQANLDVVINSTNYADDNDYSDDYDGSPGTRNGNPCFSHPADNISAAGYWTDVRVRENDTASLWRPFSPDLSARARIEIRPAISGHRFLPLAIPNNVITKVQIRYYDECRGGPPLATLDLAPLPAADQGGYAALGGGTLWALPSLSDPAVGDRNRSFPLNLPSYGGCSQTYLPIGTEVRLASRDEINLNDSCASLRDSKFADCFRRLSQIRVWDDGNPDVEPLIKHVMLTGGCATADAYFGPLPTGATDCRYGANVDVDWGSRDDNELADSTKFSVRVNGVNASPPGAATPTGVWTVPSTALVGNPGPNTVTVELDWTDTTNTRVWEQGPGTGRCRTGGSNPCRLPRPVVEPSHQAFVGTQATAGAVTLVRNSGTTFVSGLPGPPFDNIADGGTTVQLFPSIGIRSVLKTGILTTLRLDDSQANQTLRCDPNYAQGQEFSAFRYGCQPWYGPNAFTDGPWWNTTTRTCPERDLFFSYSAMPDPYGTNSSVNPWRCVPTAPGLSVPVIGEGLSVATGNCSNINSNSCQRTSCVVDGNYDGKPSDADGWLQRGGDSRDPRVVNLFIIPYQSLKGASGGDPRETVPVLGFASFYVMNWTGSNGGNSDPCPDPTFGAVTVPNPPRGAATGVFIESVDYETGPVDPNATCVEGQLIPCRASLVR